MKYPPASSQFKKKKEKKRSITVSRFLRNIKLELRDQEMTKDIVSDALKNTRTASFFNAHSKQLAGRGPLQTVAYISYF